MKSFNLIFLFVFLGSMAGSVYAQDRQVIEDTVFVDGVCDMCKKRIEEAAYGKGVKFVSWEKESKQLTVAYRADKTSLDEIEQRIAVSGHRTANHPVKREDYGSLPECCRYEHLQTH